MRACLPALGGVGDLLDPLDQLLAQIERRHQQVAEPLRAAEARDEVEEVGDVLADLCVGREHADVLVDPRRRRVVVARADVDVAPQLIAFAPNDQRRLRMDLHVGEAVDDVDARLFERARPVDVATLVEPRLELDDADDLLAVLRGLDQRRRDRGVVARPVDRRLHGDDLRIARRRLEERLDARPERVVRMLDDDVPPCDLFEQLVVVRDGEAALGERHPRRVLQVGAVERVELHHVRQVEQAADRVDLIGGDPEPFGEAHEHVARDRAGDLHPHDRAEAAPAQLPLDGFEQVVRVVRDLGVAVSRQPEQRALHDLHLREQARQEMRRARTRAGPAARVCRSRRSGRGPPAPSRVRSAPRRPPGRERAARG